MSDEEIIALAQPALRKLGQNNRWAPAPRNPARVYVHSRTVHRLIRQGALVYGNRCGSFVVAARKA